MSALDEGDRSALLDEQYELKDAQARWGMVAVALSTAGTLIKPALFAAPIGVAGIAIGALKRKEYALDRALADPPRFDFETGTRAKRRRYVPGSLGSDRLSVSADNAAIATLRASAYLEAAVRADERAQGARLRDRDDLASWHLEEHEVLMVRARQASAEMADALDSLGVIWVAAVYEAGAAEVAVPVVRRAERVPEEALDAMHRAGMVTTDLDLSFVTPAGVSPRAEVLVFADVAFETAESSRRLARSARRVARRPIELPSTTRLMIPPVATEAYVAGRRAGERGRFAESRQMLARAADLGSPDAMFELAALSREQGDSAGARRWLDMAAARAEPVVRFESERLLAPPLDLPELPPPPRQLDKGDDAD
jgi:hypothetical protein